MEEFESLERKLNEKGVIFNRADEILNADLTEIDGVEWKTKYYRCYKNDQSNDWENIPEKITADCFVFSRPINDYRSFVEQKFNENWSSYCKEIESDIQSSENVKQFGRTFFNKSVKSGSDFFSLSPIKDKDGNYYLYINGGNHRIAFLCWIGFEFDKNNLMNKLREINKFC
ncbi:hypothetical protein [Eupransor demetentiae]|uniref:Uncharacterized protein n=1 Tax=Eupransor demetentiae TaxID=3109584 RepID=A0ABM9N5S6_9LACO|nr:hypothetical protein R54876_GBNLAHCA_01132 [Lactobacillaceae bacterium LMG 33000]